jgi:hypothetical protein
LVKIDKKIISSSVIETNTVEMKNTVVQRPEQLGGMTYKIKSPLTEHSLYVTINDIEINNNLFPFEIFINSKSLDHQQWIIAITRLISSVFRQSIYAKTDATFVIRELKSVFDPHGGYRKKHSIVPSLVAEIGYVIEQHFKDIGLLKIEEKVLLNNGNEDNKNFRQCPECGSISVTRLDGCDTCLNCSYSKCN